MREAIRPAELLEAVCFDLMHLMHCRRRWRRRLERRSRRWVQAARARNGHANGHAYWHALRGRRHTLRHGRRHTLRHARRIRELHLQSRPRRNIRGHLHHNLLPRRQANENIAVSGDAGRHLYLDKRHFCCRQSQEAPRAHTTAAAWPLGLSFGKLVPKQQNGHSTPNAPSDSTHRPASVFERRVGRSHRFTRPHSPPSCQWRCTPYGVESLLRAATSHATKTI